MRLLIILLTCVFVSPLWGRTIIIGAGQPVTSLKKAIDLAKDKDSLLLLGGLYREGSMLLTKSPTIIGQNNPVLDGESKYEILLVSGKNIVIKGLTFRNSGYSAMNDFASIKLVDCSAVTLENNTIENAYFAIHISNSSFVIVRNNRIIGSPLS